MPREGVGKTRVQRICQIRASHLFVFSLASVRNSPGWGCLCLPIRKLINWVLYYIAVFFPNSAPGSQALRPSFSPPAILSLKLPILGPKKLEEVEREILVVVEPVLFYPENIFPRSHHQRSHLATVPCKVSASSIPLWMMKGQKQNG